MNDAQALQAIDIESIEELARRLAAAVSTLRIYSPQHGRAMATIEAFRAQLRRLFQSGGGRTQPFTLLCSNGLLLHESIPLGSEDSIFGQLAQAIETRGYRGITFQHHFSDEAVAYLVTWLAERLAHPLSRTLPGVLLLVDDGEGDGTGQGGGGLASPHAIADFRVPEQIHLTSQQVLERARRSLELGRGMDFKEVLELTRWVADVAIEKGNLIVAPTQLRCHDLYTFHHSVNVFLVSTALLQPFAKDREQLAVFAQAALLHDVGKTRIPYEILHKRGRLTDEEFEVIKQHPIHGAEILLESGAAHPLAVEVAYSHHMRDDGFGYPDPTPTTKPGPISRVIQVADMFEALTAHRPYKQGHTAWDAIDIILKTPGMRNSRGICALLIERLTQSPPGSEVVLSTGERAIVIETFPDAPQRPRVRVIESVDGERLDHPVEVDLREMAGGHPIRQVCLKPLLARPSRAAITPEEVGLEPEETVPIEVEL